jgi:hypothetical protein
MNKQITIKGEQKSIDLFLKKNYQFMKVYGIEIVVKQEKGLKEK